MFHSYVKRALSAIYWSFTELVSPRLMRTFGIFGIINFSFQLIIGQFYLGETEASIILRLSSFTLCIFLAFCDYWPLSLQRYQIPCWFFTITYCIPFFATYMLLENEGSFAWQVKITIGLFWLVLITDWIQFIVILSTGIALGLLSFSVISGPISWEISNYIPEIINYLWGVVIAAIFARNKDLVQKEKEIIALKSLSASIAHEMRTPLFTLKTVGYSLKKIFPALLKSYQKETSTSSDKVMDKEIEKILKTTPEIIENTTREAFTIIDILLVNLKGTQQYPIEVCSMNQCIREALNEYPFTEEDKKLINWDEAQDFKFIGNIVLMKYVLFNLIRNSLYHIKVANKGSIQISLIVHDKMNLLSFKDTGNGIPADILPHIFTPFCSNTKYGTGVGLYFCQKAMNDFSGKIECYSKEHEYTEFILKFPYCPQ